MLILPRPERLQEWWARTAHLDERRINLPLSQAGFNRMGKKAPESNRVWRPMSAEQG
jgi:hypothetical protein